MYTYMYCMYRIERHNSRRLLLRAASICAIREKTGFVSLFCGFMDRSAYLGGVGEILAR